MQYRSLAACLVFFLLVKTASAAMTSTNYQIGWDDFNGGGSDTGSSLNYRIQDTMGDPIAGYGSSTNYQVSAGYRAQATSTALSLLFKGQTNESRTAYTAFNDAGKTVTVASAVPFVVGDHIAVVENLGFAQKVAVGKILSIAGLILTVDGWAGNSALMNAVPAGGNDFVYTLTNTTAAFGSISAGSENTTTALTSVRSSVPSGYTVYFQANQLLQDTNAHAISSVLDGVVSVGSEEYGASTIGSLAVNPGVDVGVTTTQRAIQTSAAPSGSVPDRVAQIYKLSVNGATVAGNYGQTIYYTLTANY